MKEKTSKQSAKQKLSRVFTPIEHFKMYTLWW